MTAKLRDVVLRRVEAADFVSKVWSRRYKSSRKSGGGAQVAKGSAIPLCLMSFSLSCRHAQQTTDWCSSGMNGSLGEVRDPELQAAF